MMKKKEIVIYGFLTIVAAYVILSFFPQTFPSANLPIKVDIEQAKLIADKFLLALKQKKEKYYSTAWFDYDKVAMAYLYKNCHCTNNREFGQLPLIFWRVRFFKELDKENIIVDINPITGRIQRFVHTFPEEKEGAFLTKEQALKAAENYAKYFSVDLSFYNLVENKEEVKPKRKDYWFEWSKKLSLGDSEAIKQNASYRVLISINGEQLGVYKEFIKIPEQFIHKLNIFLSRGITLSHFSISLTYLIIFLGVIVLLIKLRPSKINWKEPFILSAVFFFLYLLKFFNSLPSIWRSYPDNLDMFSFIFRQLGDNIIAGIAGAFLLFSMYLIGSIYYKQVQNNQVKTLNKGTFLNKIIIGYSLGSIIIALTTLYYLWLGKGNYIWFIPNLGWNNALTDYFPFFSIFTNNLAQVFQEEVIYRMFIISFLFYCLPRTKLGRILAVVLAGFIWSLAHINFSVFPASIKVIEVFIVSAAMGIFFLEYGLAVVIIAHWVMNSWALALPLICSKNFYFSINGWILLFTQSIIFLLSFVFLALGNRKQAVRFSNKQVNSL